MTKIYCDYCGEIMNTGSVKKLQLMDFIAPNGMSKIDYKVVFDLHPEKCYDFFIAEVKAIKERSEMSKKY